ncbi:hypothetical protein CPLU01_07178 [Colletotrichum plurivorum]|uniref:Uncharacterized protein n=1 Tax=Colletotrichum plurivorum TaxID=2175906 RepID=A0A8H6KGM1_9PEZI|nr:hypothetical protein CPLU01_07178 [Colletotrichum plurivorum]
MQAHDPGAMPAAPAPCPSNSPKGWSECFSHIFAVQMRHKAAAFQSILAVGTMATSLFVVYGTPGRGLEDMNVTICDIIFSCLLGVFWSLKSRRPYSFSLVATVVAFVIHGKLSGSPEHVFADTLLELPLCIISGSIMAWLYFKSITSGHGMQESLQTALGHFEVGGPAAV